MQPLQVKGVISYEETGKVEESLLLDTVQQHINSAAFVYTVMDHAVALGLYQNGQIQIKLKPEKEIMDFSVPYVQELRVFTEDVELRAIRNGGAFCWRLRVDEKDSQEKDSPDSQEVCSPESGQLYRLDEIHKLWGSVRNATDQGKWSLLSTQRGSAIYFPGEVPLHGERGLVVRNYIQIASTDEQNGLVQFVDERLCRFVNWPVTDTEV